MRKSGTAVFPGSTPTGSGSSQRRTFSRRSSGWTWTTWAGCSWWSRWSTTERCTPSSSRSIISAGPVRTSNKVCLFNIFLLISKERFLHRTIKSLSHLTIEHHIMSIHSSSSSSLKRLYRSNKKYKMFKVLVLSTPKIIFKVRICLWTECSFYFHFYSILLKTGFYNTSKFQQTGNSSYSSSS